MLRTLGIGVLALLGIAVLGVGALVVRSRQPLDAPWPWVAPDTSPEGLARGKVLFHATCAQCHRGPGSQRASGAALTEIPAFIGTFHARNITRHPTAGIGAFEDQEIARLLRFGITRDGRAAVMPTYNLSDGDLAAVLGFLRSDDPLFEADPSLSPPSEPSLIGGLLVSLSLPDPAGRPADGVTAPPKAATKEYGRYLAHDVFDCAGCHTPGYSPDKTAGPSLLTGGAEFVGAAGEAIRSPNLTAHATGIGDWSLEDFSRALREGVKPDGTGIKPPMPLLRGLEDAEIEALFLYLRSVPAQPGEVPASRPDARRTVATAAPEAQFETLGCAGCHAPGARFHEALLGARDKDAHELAEWILHPEALRPGTPMPSYGAVLSEENARTLARWVKGKRW